MDKGFVDGWGLDVESENESGGVDERREGIEVDWEGRIYSMCLENVCYVKGILMLEALMKARTLVD